MSFDNRFGEHLRKVRQQTGLSLLDVEAASGKEFKASVVGAYERGERAITVRRLARLAEVYRVPLHALLPGDGRDKLGEGDGAGVSIDLGRVEVLTGDEGRTLARYVRSLQEERGDWGGRVLTMRRDDLRALASALDLSSADLSRRLLELGVVAEAKG